MERNRHTSLPLSSKTASMTVLFGASWWNHWTSEDMEPLWPETYDSMPSTVQALMPGLRAAERRELYEPAFNQSDFNFARFERRRKEAQGAGEAVTQGEVARCTGKL